MNIYRRDLLGTALPAAAATKTKAAPASDYRETLQATGTRVLGIGFSRRSTAFASTKATYCWNPSNKSSKTMECTTAWC